MKNIKITAQYIALERTDNGAIDAQFLQSTSELSINKTTISIIRNGEIIQINTVWDRQCDTKIKN